MSKITNLQDVSLALAVWLVHDEYDYIDQPNYVSATSLMKPLRQIVLGPRATENEPPDVVDFISRAMGNSMHASIEKAWTDNYPRSLKLLGYPDKAIESIKINPSDEKAAEPGTIPIYLEQRAFRTIKVNGTEFTIGGKFDLVTDGLLQDTKSTSSFVWMKGDRQDKQYQLQGSIYRWIDAAQPRPKILEDVIRINFIFTDWQKHMAKSNPSYPQKRVESRDIPLLSLEATEQWIMSKLTMIERYKNTAEPNIPECSDEELWRSDPVHKYYSDPNNTSGRSTKNFDNLADAQAFYASKGGKGVVLSVPGEPKRCGYCPVFNVCTQKDRYFTP